MKACRVLLIGLLLIALTLVSCGGDSSPEDQVREFLAEATSAVESRGVLDVRDLISERYTDEQGRDKRSLTGIATGYFLRNKNIHLFTQVEEIAFPASGQARVRMLVAMLGSPVENAEALLDIRADIYRFELTIVKEKDKWRLQKSYWAKGKLEDLFSD